MDQLHALRVFIRVAELRSFSRAAENLGSPKASVSATIQKLEAALGTRLLHRTTRLVRLTADGELYHRRGKELLGEFEDLHDLFAPCDASLRGRLRIDMPAALAHDLVLPALPALLDRFPALDIDLSGTDHRVDLVAEGFDCVLRVGTVRDSSLVARPLGSLPQISCASPAYLARHGTPHSLPDLAQHLLVRYQSSASQNAAFDYLDPDSGLPRQLAMPARLTVHTTEDYLAAAQAGLGLIQAPRYALQPRVDAGALVEVLPHIPPPPLPVSLLYANRRQLPPRTRVFMHWLEELLQPILQA